MAGEIEKLTLFPLKNEAGIAVHPGVQRIFNSVLLKYYRGRIEPPMNLVLENPEFFTPMRIHTALENAEYEIVDDKVWRRRLERNTSPDAMVRVALTTARIARTDDGIMLYSLLAIFIKGSAVSEKNFRDDEEFRKQLLFAVTMLVRRNQWTLKENEQIPPVYAYSIG